MIRLGIQNFLRMPILIAGPIALLASTPGHACTCLKQPSAAAAMAEATAVVSGVVQSISADGAESVVRLQVSGSWKGVTSSEMEVRTPADPDACGLDFKIGDSYLVYVYPRTGLQGTQLTTTSCTRTTRMDAAGGDLDALGPMTAPASGSRD